MRSGNKGKRKVSSPISEPKKPQKVVKQQRGSSSRAAAVGIAPTQLKNPAQPLRRSARLNPSQAQIPPMAAPIAAPSEPIPSQESQSSKKSSSASKANVKSKPVERVEERADIGQAELAKDTGSKPTSTLDLASAAEDFKKSSARERGHARKKQQAQQEEKDDQLSGSGKKRRRPATTKEDSSRPPAPPTFSQPSPAGKQRAPTPSYEDQSIPATGLLGNWSYSLVITVSPPATTLVNEPISPAPVVELKITDPSGQNLSDMDGVLGHMSIIASLYDETGTQMLRSPSSGGYIKGIYMKTPQEYIPTAEDDDNPVSAKKYPKSREAANTRTPTPEPSAERNDGGLVALTTFDNLVLLKAGRFKLKFSAMATEVGNNSPSGQSQPSTEISEQQLGGSRCKAQVLSDVFTVT